MEKELWTINGIIKDYKESRSKIEFLENYLPKKYLKWEDLEFDHEPKYIDVKMNDNKYKLVVGYNVVGNNLVILRNNEKEYYFLEGDKQFFNDLHLEVIEKEPKKYLKWEDLKFVYGEWNKAVVLLGNEILEIRYKSDFDFFDSQYEVVEICNINTKGRICKIYDRNKHFFNNLHLEVIENE